MNAARALQRRLRSAAPGITAQLTWAWKRRGDQADSLAVVDALVSRGDAALDIGANWGLYTARLARLVGEAGQVDAFEPHPDHTRTLRSLARRRAHVAVHFVALSDAPGSAELHVPVVDGRRVTALGSLAPPDAEVEHEVTPVPVVRLDDVMAKRRPPSFVKCDVEGLELRVLRGAETTLRRSRPALLVEIEQRHQTRPIGDTFRYLEELGYAGWYFGPGGLAPLEQFDVERDQLAHLGPGVVEYGMPEGYVADFLFAAPGADVPGLISPARRRPRAPRTRARAARS